MIFFLNGIRLLLAMRCLLDEINYAIRHALSTAAFEFYHKGHFLINDLIERCESPACTFFQLRHEETINSN